MGSQPSPPSLLLSPGPTIFQPQGRLFSGAPPHPRPLLFYFSRLPARRLGGATPEHKRGD